MPPSRLPRSTRPLIAAAIGAVWGAIGFLVLWGHTPLFPSRRFVVSAPGTLLLLPVRIVLAGIRFVERQGGRTFELASNNWWIGALSVAVGAGLAALTVLVSGVLIRRFRSTPPSRQTSGV